MDMSMILAYIMILLMLMILKAFKIFNEKKHNVNERI